MKERLTKADWVAEGLRTLATEGIANVKVATMSERLSVSRGSFYWHFGDVADLRKQMLTEWRDEATEQVIRRIEHDDPARRFQALMRRAFVSDRGLERAVRSWGAIDNEAAVIIAEVDARRIAYIARVVADQGVSRGQALLRARFAYWAFLGQPHVMDPDGAVITERQIDRISELLVG